MSAKHRETARANAFLISIIGGVTMLLLAVTVFAVASQARSVSEQAERSVRLIEDLRVVSIARAELSVASRIDAVAPDQTVVIESTINNADEALAAVIANVDEDTSRGVVNALATYEAAADDQAALILRSDTDVDLAQAAEVRTGEAFSALSKVLRAEQETALDQLRLDNDVMNTIGTIATFVVAFIVPSASLYIFEALRRTPRLTRTLELELASLGNTSQAMAIAVSNEIKTIRSTMQLPPGDDQDDHLHRSLLRLEHVANLNGAVRPVHNDELNVYTIAVEAAERFSNEIDVRFVEAEYPAVVSGDRDQLTLIVFELLANALDHGSTPVSVEINTTENAVRLSVIDRGIGLPELIEAAVVDEDDYAARGNLISGRYGFGLLAVREAAESLGGRLDYVRTGAETSMIVEFPRTTNAQITRYEPPISRRAA